MSGCHRSRIHALCSTEAEALHTCLSYSSLHRNISMCQITRTRPFPRTRTRSPSLTCFVSLSIRAYKKRELRRPAAAFEFLKDDGHHRRSCILPTEERAAQGAAQYIFRYCGCRCRCRCILQARQQAAGRKRGETASRRSLLDLLTHT